MHSSVSLPTSKSLRAALRTHPTRQQVGAALHRVAQSPTFWVCLMFLGNALLLLTASSGAFAEGLSNPFMKPICDLYKNILEPAKGPIILMSIVIVALGFLAAPFASRWSSQVRQNLQPVFMGVVLFALALPLAGVLAGSTMSC